MSIRLKSRRAHFVLPGRFHLICPQYYFYVQPFKRTLCWVCRVVFYKSIFILGHLVFRSYIYGTKNKRTIIWSILKVVTLPTLSACVVDVLDIIMLVYVLVLLVIVKTGLSKKAKWLCCQHAIFLDNGVLEILILVFYLFCRSRSGRQWWWLTGQANIGGLRIKRTRWNAYHFMNSCVR